MAKLIQDIKKVITDSGNSIPVSSLIIDLLEQNYDRYDIVATIHEHLDLGTLQLGNNLNIELGEEIN